MRAAFVAASGIFAAGVALHPSVAGAQWGASGVGPTAAAAAVMPSGNQPSAVSRSSTVTITWPAATFADGAAVAGYVIQRYDAINGTMAAVGGTCSGIVTTLSCTESSVPPGNWAYTDTPEQGTWTGGASPASAVVSV